jgi:glutaredoxin 3
MFALFFSSAAAFIIKVRPAVSGTRLYHTYSPKETAQAAIKASKIMVFSKTHCPYCKKAKEAITQLTPLFSVVELDVIKDGEQMQAALLEMTGQKTVPSIFVGGKHIGGCDATLAAIASGQFQTEMAKA